MHFVSLVTCLALLLYFSLAFLTGRARIKYSIAPPATGGHPDFDRVFRTQMNTLEQMVFFLPSLWLFARYVSPIAASLLGMIWIIGRILYASGYYQQAKKRLPGFYIAATASIILWLGAFLGIMARLLA